MYLFENENLVCWREGDAWNLRFIVEKIIHVWSWESKSAYDRLIKCSTNDQRYHIIGFPDSSLGKESACNARDLGWIPGSGRSSGKGIGYPLQYNWGSLVAQLVKNPPAKQETWVWFLGWEDLEKGKATHSSILAWRIPYSGAAKSQTLPSSFRFHHIIS